MVSWPTLEEVATGIVNVLDPLYGEDAPLEFVAEAVTPFVETVQEPVGELPYAVDLWVSEHLAETAAPVEAVTGGASVIAGSELIPAIKESFLEIVSPSSIQESFRDIITPYAESYVDWYEEGTPVERAVDVVFEAGAGVGQEVEDIAVATAETVPAIIEAGGTAGATIIGSVLDPITEPLGEGIEKLIVPAAIVGGAYLLLK